MAGQIAARIELAAVGAFGGAALWAVVEASDRDWIGQFPTLALFTLVLTGFGATLAMAGPLSLRRAAPRAVALALVVGALVWLTTLRYSEADQFFGNPMQVMAAFTVATLPVPFLVAGARGQWRDYPTLFLEAWSALMRIAAAGAFTGLVWLVIFLSDEVLRIVGINVISRIISNQLFALSLGGAIFGLGMAVIHDLADLLSPYVVLRVFRLFLPAVLAVMAVFLVALPFRGLDGLVSGLSPATLLLTMVAGGIALVSIAVDQTDADATKSRLLVTCTKAMALILPVMAALALWAIWLRVADHGWSPERLFVLLVAVTGIGYGLIYAASVLRGGAWMERIRQGNILMALAIAGLAALWLTPVLNAERISAKSQLARFDAGKTTVEDLDVPALWSWGKPGAEAIQALSAKAEEPGQEALANLLTGQGHRADPHRPELAAELAAVMPVQPASASGTQGILLAAVEDYLLQDWRRVCETKLENGQPGCLMAVGDLMPTRPGEEAMIFLQRSSDYTEILGLYLDDGGRAAVRQVAHPDGRYITPAQASALLREYQETPPPLTAAELNQFGTGDSGLLVLP